jgi:hypothetical protein
MHVTDWMRTFEGDIIWQSRVMLRDMRLEHDKNSAFTVPFFNLCSHHQKVELA